jgi:hypothetical protein
MSQDELEAIAARLRQLPERFQARQLKLPDAEDAAGQLLARAIELGAFSAERWYFWRDTVIRYMRHHQQPPSYAAGFTTAIERMKRDAGELGVKVDLPDAGSNKHLLGGCPLLADLIEQSGSDGRRSKQKQPPDYMIQAYRMRWITGWKQAQIAEAMTTELGRTIKQPKVSEWLKRVRDWLEAGNVLPDIADHGDSQPISESATDPELLDMGQRQDGRTPRQRERWEDD